jgi:putative N6-adenine-specific DNA methylase
MLDLLATTHFGMEAVVVRELQALGYEDAKPVQTGRILFQGSHADICEACLRLRVAGRVMIQLDSFACPDFDALYDRTRALPWEEWIAPECAFPVRGRSVRSTLSSVPAVQRTVKKAIVDRLLEAHAVDELPESGPECAIEIAILHDRASLLLDPTGEGMHRRGYRDLSGEAQLKETMAAGLVLLSFWKPGKPLVDPFCGTGTIPIEAAMIAAMIAPGLNRSFAAELWPTFDQSLWESARARAAAERIAGAPVPQQILAADSDPDVMSIVRRHAKRAGVGGWLDIKCQEFGELHSNREYGCIVTIPPYGERLGDQRGLEPLYATFPDVFRRLPTWSQFVITAMPNYEQIVGRVADRRRKLYNAKIECTYYQHHGPKPPREAHAKSSDVIEVGDRASDAG